ncbi:MAG: ribosome biogenesis GTPase Der [Synergistaceae bacterium]|nr:ribosome biogenesis GTPase Der [Synergistaceae bacterium]MBR0220801.1 ribosome biogenesis GTPase Der [Synergistaceae bacterium]
MAGIVAIIGRPNVGKSSLFNRLTGSRDAIVDNTPGVTRDRLYGEVEWRGENFYVIDTGGIMGEDTAFSKGIKSHVDAAISECDAVLMVMDGKTGVTSSDQEIADLLRRSNKPVILAVNKIDDIKHEEIINEAYELGLENVIGVSALHKRNLDELLNLIINFLPDDKDDYDNQDGEGVIRLAIAGRPNVGKSSLLNKLSGKERSLVSPVAGTTRDPVDMLVNIDNQDFRIVDTAGLRRKSKFINNKSSSENDLEYYSFVRTLAAIDRSDVVLLLMDAETPCTDQDKKIAAHIAGKGKGLVLIINKWDLVAGKVKLGDNLIKKVKDEMPFVNWAPVIFASALTGRSTQKIAPLVKTVYENRKNRIATNTLNKLMRDVLAFDRLPSNKKGRTLKIYYCSQVDAEPPTFIFFVNEPEIVNNAFENHVRNELRNLADFNGTPVRVFWRGKDRSE